MRARKKVARPLETFEARSYSTDSAFYSRDTLAAFMYVTNPPLSGSGGEKRTKPGGHTDAVTTRCGYAVHTGCALPSTDDERSNSPMRFYYSLVNYYYYF